MRYICINKSLFKKELKLNPNMTFTTTYGQRHIIWLFVPRPKCWVKLRLEFILSHFHQYHGPTVTRATNDAVKSVSIGHLGALLPVTSCIIKDKRKAFNGIELEWRFMITFCFWDTVFTTDWFHSFKLYDLTRWRNHIPISYTM